MLRSLLWQDMSDIMAEADSSYWVFGTTAYNNPKNSALGQVRPSEEILSRCPRFCWCWSDLAAHQVAWLCSAVDTKLSLTTWFWAAHLMATHSNGMSAQQLMGQLGLGSYKTAAGMRQDGAGPPDADKT